jgi:type VI secretion system protein ImpK
MSSVPPQPIDPDATMMVPTPGRRRAAGFAASSAAGAGFAAPAAGGDLGKRPEAAVSADLSALPGLNPLVALANGLLALVPQIRGSLAHSDPAGFRETLVQQLFAFEEAAAKRGIKPETVTVARYALCTLLDEAVSSTPWGGTAQWMRDSLLVTFYRETGGGEKFFLLLNKMAEQPGANIDLLEFFYACLALGFEGRFRVIEGGKAQLEQIRERLFELIRRQRQNEDTDLSVRWKGIETKLRRVSGGLALWLAASACALVLAAVYLTYLVSLANKSSPLKSELAQMKVKVALERVAPAKAVAPRLSRHLAEEIDKGLVAVYEDEQVSVVTIAGDGLFASGSAAVDRRFEPTFARVAQALDSVPGPVVITGHTDNKPIRTARFPSNWELSTERAKSVMKVMAGSIGQPARLRAEGMADSDPVAANDTEDNRRKNRRVMVILKVAG